MSSNETNDAIMEFSKGKELTQTQANAIDRAEKKQPSNIKGKRLPSRMKFEFSEQEIVDFIKDGMEKQGYRVESVDFRDHENCCDVGRLGALISYVEKAQRKKKSAKPITEEDLIKLKLSNPNSMIIGNKLVDQNGNLLAKLESNL